MFRPPVSPAAPLNFPQRRRDRQVLGIEEDILLLFIGRRRERVLAPLLAEPALAEVAAVLGDLVLVVGLGLGEYSRVALLVPPAALALAAGAGAPLAAFLT